MPPIEPATPTLEALIGFDYFDTFGFWSDNKNTVEFDFTQPDPGWSNFRMEICAITLTEGSGLTVDAAHGKISPSIAESVTVGEVPGSVSYQISALDPDGKLECL